jgi:transposase
LAETIDTWWPAVEVFLTTGLTNARTEGTNRLIKRSCSAGAGVICGSGVTLLGVSA